VPLRTCLIDHINQKQTGTLFMFIGILLFVVIGVIQQDNLGALVDFAIPWAVVLLAIHSGLLSQQDLSLQQIVDGGLGLELLWGREGLWDRDLWGFLWVGGFEGRKGF
jgi:hypothetical protein